MLWTAKEMIEAMDGRPLAPCPRASTGISIDSRTIGEGEAFFAIKGDRFDGHNFASVAVANGASLLLVDESKLPALGRVTAPMIVVNECWRRSRISAAPRAPGRTAKIIAITGSVGKPRTKEMLRRALEPTARCNASTASFNNHWGVPLTLARMPVSAAYGVFEIGITIRARSPAGQDGAPACGAHHHDRGGSHGQFQESRRDRRRQAEIMEGIDKDGHLLLNRDNEKIWLAEETRQRSRSQAVHSFGENAKADFRLLNCKLLPDCSTITAP